MVIDDGNSMGEQFWNLPKYKVENRQIQFVSTGRDALIFTNFRSTVLLRGMLSHSPQLGHNESHFVVWLCRRYVLWPRLQLSKPNQYRFFLVLTFLSSRQPTEPFPRFCAWAYRDDMLDPLLMTAGKATCTHRQTCKKTKIATLSSINHIKLKEDVDYKSSH